MGSFLKIVRSLRAFQRELTRIPPAAPPAPTARAKIGLALGGGFARGLAHIGVLKIFEEEKIPIDFVAGTSVGSIVGALYCSGVSAKELEEIAAVARFKDFARWTISRYGFWANDRMVSFFDRLLKGKTFEELRIPLAITATDFATGEGVIFRSGPLVCPVRASCAYPGMFPPINVNGRLLVDGMLAHSVPTAPLREMGAEHVIAVSLSAHWVSQSPRHVFDVIGQCFSIAQAKTCGIWQAAADVVLEPDVKGFSYDSFERAPELIRAGETAARKALAKIKEWQPAAGAAGAEKDKKPRATILEPAPGTVPLS